MIISLTGNVSYTITLDPSVWIFDDRKILFDDAFSKQFVDKVEDDELEEAAQRWSRAVEQQRIKPPVNKSISRFEREKILVNSYVMPIYDFIGHAEIKVGSQNATLVTNKGNVDISLEKLKNCYLLFAINGKQVKEDGPVHLFYKDGSNKDSPIKGIHKIIINK